MAVVSRGVEVAASMPWLVLQLSCVKLAPQQAVTPSTGQRVGSCPGRFLYPFRHPTVS